MRLGLIRIATSVGVATLVGTSTPWVTARAPAQTTPQRVLFVGNSLTTTNDLPGLVAALARAEGHAPIDCRTVAFGNYSLEDHWNRGDAIRAIAEGGWRIVVLQQGPSSLPESEVLLREFTRRFAAKARDVKAKTALYMVWPSADRLGDLDGVSRSYRNAARDVDGLLLPVGEAWRAAWRRDPRLALYGSDGFHPSPLGSYLAALVIYQQVSGTSPKGLPASLASASGTRIVVPPGEAGLLQEAAAEANARFGGR